jgi:dsDNA-binding SOS-regulon protein
METYTETGWILTAYNQERKICFGAEQEVDAYLSLLNSTKEINHWEKAMIEVFSEEQEAQAFSIFEALREMEDCDE